MALLALYAVAQARAKHIVSSIGGLTKRPYKYIQSPRPIN